MGTTLDPDNIPARRARKTLKGHDVRALGPSDSSDTGSDMAGPGLLDAVTNYECYKGLYSSHNDRNYFEIAHSLNRLFGDGGLYRGLTTYNFADNHDVNRIASVLRNAFISAFARSLEGSITLRDVKKNLEDIDPNKEEAGEKKDEKDAKKSPPRETGPPGKR